MQEKLGTKNDAMNPEDAAPASNKRLQPKIFDAANIYESVPEGFNAVRLQLDASLQADLEWKEARLAAKQHEEKGLGLFWDLQLGLFDVLRHPLANQTQFLSLCLSLEHFRDFLWKDFRDSTLGVCLYRGPADFSRCFPWDEQQESNLRSWLKSKFESAAAFSEETGLAINSWEHLEKKTLEYNPKGKNLLSLFCCDACVDYITLLASRLPDGLNGFLLLDASEIETASLEAMLLSKERFDNLSLGIHQGHLPLDRKAIAWNSGASSTGFIARSLGKIQGAAPSPPHIGLCLPPRNSWLPSLWTEMQNILETLLHANASFRVIPEEHLITEWDGLDYLITSSRKLTSIGKRKLQGFCAAGGTVVVLGSPIGLAYETAFDEHFIKNTLV